MNVQVIFQGLMLWWMAGAQPALLIPNFAHEPTAPHYAAITARKEAFVGMACPSPFTIDAASGGCRFVLDGAGATGGVRISFEGDGAAPKTAATQELCALPPIAGPQNLELLPDYTPSSNATPQTGSALTAWMPVAGGAAGSFTKTCINDSTDPGDCPRGAVWSVAPPVAGTVVLHLDNLLAGKAATIRLRAGAVLTIVNEPALTQDASAAQRANHAPAQMAAHAMTGGPLDASHWCLYYKMFKGPGGTGMQCSGPAIPSSRTCGVKSPIVLSATPETLMIGTIACSNSQYP